MAQVSLHRPHHPRPPLWRRAPTPAMTTLEVRVVTARIGVLADIHADAVALQAALDQLDKIGVDQILCAGDVVNGADEPEAVIALLQERGIPTVLGNHDRWSTERHARGEPEHDGDAGSLHLSSGAVGWLAKLPTSWFVTVEGVRICACHGSPLSDSDPIWPDDPDDELQQWLHVAQADVLVVGHSHIPFARRLPGGLIVNPGALWRGAEAAAAAPLSWAGRRADGRIQGGAYGVLELPALQWTLHRIQP